MPAPEQKITTDWLSPELVFTTARSSGPGGQNVNKVNTKVILKWDVAHSQLVSAGQKETITGKLSSRITTEGVLVISCQEKRSQLQNKEEALLKLEKLLAKAFEKRKARKATKPTKSAVRQRIESKKKRSDLKKWRQKPE